METDFDGPLSVTRAFAPTLASNGGGAIVNVLSVRSWPHALAFGAYNAAKTAASGMANVVRQELVPRGIHVAALHLRSMDTDIVADVAAPRADPDAVAVPTLGGIEADLTEILADDLTRSVQQGIAAPPASRV